MGTYPLSVSLASPCNSRLLHIPSALENSHELISTGFRLLFFRRCCALGVGRCATCKRGEVGIKRSVVGFRNQWRNTK